MSVPALNIDEAVRIEELSKTFPSQRALDCVSLNIRRGEIHALVGQNGSGKSTLIKVLSGFHKPDEGARAWFRGEPVTLGRLSEEQLGSMRFVHQDLALVPSLTVQENLYLADTGRGLLAPVDGASERSAVRELLRTFDLDIDPSATIGSLSPYERAAVAIVRGLGAVTDDVNLLVLDEPTASLGAAETQQLFQTLRRINGLGVAVLYVSHFLGEVLEIADRISVLRDGRQIAVLDAKSTTEKELIAHIVGTNVTTTKPPPLPDVQGTEQARLRVEGLCARGLDDAWFSVAAGEIVGLTGLQGSGYETIAECLSGVEPFTGGKVTIVGHSFTALTPSSAATAGMVAMPADRRNRGLIGSFTITENLTLPDIGRYFRRGRIDSRAEEQEVRRWLDICGVVPSEPSRRVDELSGGNQQKVMLAKVLRLDPHVLILAEPTQAVDVGAAATIRKLIAELAERGHAVVITSSDPEEIEELCHRVLITRNQRIACELQGPDIAEERIVFECQFEGSGDADQDAQ